MTDFMLRSCSDQSVNIRSSIKSTVHPKPTIEVPINWDKTTNRPKMSTISDGLEVGAGILGKLGLDIILSFNSIWDVKIMTTINLDVKFGAEIVVPDNFEKDLPDKDFDIFPSIPIAPLGVGFKFLNLEVSLGAFMNFDTGVSNIKISIPIGFDYFKGYQMSATKFFEITPFSISDSKWNIYYSSLPEVNSINDVLKKLESASLSLDVECKPCVSFGINLGDLTKIELKAGIKIPLSFLFSYDKDTCMWPYIKGDVSIPVAAFLEFSGISVKKIKIIDPYEKDFHLFNIPLPTFCVGGFKVAIEGSDKNIQTSSKVVFYAKNYNFKETRAPGVSQVQKQISFMVKEGNYQSKNIALRNYPYTYYGSSVSNNEVNLVISDIPETSIFYWNLYFRNNENSESQISPLYAYISYNKFTFPNGYSQYINSQLYRSENKNDDKLEFRILLEKCQYIEPGKVFKRDWNYVVFQPPITSNSYYGMLYFTETGEIKINNANYVTDTMVNSEYAQKTYFNYIMERDFRIYLISFQPKINCRVVLDVIYNDKITGKSVSLGTFSTGDLIANKLYTAEQLKLNDIVMPVSASLDMTLEIKGRIETNSGSDRITFENIYFIHINTDPVQTMQLSDYVTAVFRCDVISPHVTADCSGRINDKNPPQELLSRIISLDASDFDNSFKITFLQDEGFIILMINVPTKFKNQNLGFISTSAAYLEFLTKGRTIYNSVFSYINVGTQSKIYIPVRKSPGVTGSYFNLRLIYFILDTPQIQILDREAPLAISYQRDTLCRAFLVTAVNGSFNFQIMHYKKFVDYQIKLNDNEYIYMLRHEEADTVDRTLYFFLSHTFIGDTEPSITLSLNYQQIYYDHFKNCKMTVFCNHGQKILAKINGETYIEPLDKTKDKVVFTFNTIGNVTFIPICYDNTESYCQITYETPSESGYHLIQYSNRDGITVMDINHGVSTIDDSTSNTDFAGSGFYTEIIPVVKGRNFTYYQTYPGALKIVRKFPSDTKIEIKMKLDDLKNYNGFEKARRFCLVDASDPDLIIPFSRKYFSENMDTLIDSIGFDPEGDFEKFTNDKNGCIYFHADYIKTNDIKQPKPEVCDLPLLSESISLDLSNMSFKPKSKIPVWLIVIIVVVVVLVVIVVTIIICKCKKKKKENIDDQSVDSMATTNI